jgi:hypothetical protein
LLNNYWRPTLTVISLEGLPPVGGKVVVSQEIKARCSMRLPPTLNSQWAKDRVTEIISE